MGLQVVTGACHNPQLSLRLLDPNLGKTEAVIFIPVSEEQPLCESRFSKMLPGDRVSYSVLVFVCLLFVLFVSACVGAGEAYSSISRKTK